MAMSSVSVVTNALRLRGFRPAASVQEILHPPLRARIADWGYLAAIAVLALAIGAGALWLSERGGMGVGGGMEGQPRRSSNTQPASCRAWLESRHATSTLFRWTWVRHESSPCLPHRLRGGDQQRRSQLASMMEHVTVTAPDISCAHCVATVKEAVGALPGVASVEADLSSKRVEIDFDPGRVSLAQIAAALDEAGYPVAQ